MGWEWMMIGLGVVLIALGPVVLFVIASWMRRSGNGGRPSG